MTTILSFLRTHPALALALATLVSALANALIKYVTSPRWAELLARYPRVAALCKLLEHAGFALPQVIQWAAVLVTGKIRVATPPVLETPKEPTP